MRLIIFILNVFLVSSCVEQKGKESFESIISRFDSRLVDHFPEDFNEVYDRVEYYPSEAIPNTGAFARLTVKYSLEEIIRIKQKFQLKEMIRHSSYDCFNCKYSLRDSTYTSECKLDTIPIPVFNYLQGKLGKSKFLEDDFEIYILEAKPEKVLPDYMLAKDFCKNWNNGFIKGLIINNNKKLITYWVEIW
ncbi:MAG: hypothetical protein AAF693_22070 [Bacteroidota bacterium]